MVGKRLLVIEKLVVAVPDVVQSSDGREELSIDDILMWLLQYRKTADAVTKNNRYGDFTYFASDMPKGVTPDDNVQFTAQGLVDYLSESPDRYVAGVITSLIFDERLGSYRNAYPADCDDELQERIETILKMRAAAMEKSGADDTQPPENDDTHPCDGCESICDENCPNSNTR